MELINDNLTMAIIGLLTLGLGYFTYFLNKYSDKINLQIKNIKRESERTLFENALKDLHDLILHTVTYAEQVFVKELKAKSSDGKLTKDEMIQVSAEVMSSIMKSITPKSKEVLSKNIIDVEKYVEKVVETKVFEMKK